MKRVLLYLIGAVLIILIGFGIFITNSAQKGREITQRRQILLESWYEKNNPSHNSSGPQPTEEDMRQIRIEAYKTK